MVLPEDDPEGLRKSFRIADEWAREIRMRWNVGTEKSAIMAWGRCRISTLDSRKVLRLSSSRVPRVPVYKYGGVVLSSGGGWQHHLKYVQGRTINKTGELIEWARRHQASADLLA